MAWKGTFFGAVIGLLITTHGSGEPCSAPSSGSCSIRACGVGCGAARGAAASVSEVFFRTTFELMGHVAKSDGRVSEAEIDAARRLMQELHLGPARNQHRDRMLSEPAKSPAYDASLSVEQLREACGLRYDLLRAFMELQLRAALGGQRHLAAGARAF